MTYWLSGVHGAGPSSSGGVIGTLVPTCGEISVGGVGGGQAEFVGPFLDSGIGRVAVPHKDVTSTSLGR